MKKGMSLTRSVDKCTCKQRY